MTRYEQGFIKRACELGCDPALVKKALFHWTHHLVPWETNVELRRKARRAIFAAENGHSGVARKIMDSRYKDPKMEELVAFIRDAVKRKAETQAKIEDIKRTGVWDKPVEGNPFNNGK